MAKSLTRNESVGVTVNAAILSKAYVWKKNSEIEYLHAKMASLLYLCHHVLTL